MDEAGDLHLEVRGNLLRDEPEGQGGIGLVQVAVLASLIEAFGRVDGVPGDEVLDVGLGELLGVLAGARSRGPGETGGGAVLSRVVLVGLGAGGHEHGMAAVLQAGDHHLGDVGLHLLVGVVVADGELDAGQGVTEQDAGTTALVFLEIGFFVDRTGSEQDVLLLGRRFGRLIVEGDGLVGVVDRQVAHASRRRRHVEIEGHRTAGLVPKVEAELTAPGIAAAGNGQRIERTIRRHAAGSAPDFTVEGVAKDVRHILLIDRGAAGLGDVVREGTHLGDRFGKEIVLAIVRSSQVVIETLHGHHHLRGAGGDASQDEAHLVVLGSGDIDVLLSFAGANEGSDGGDGRQDNLLSHDRFLHG